MKIRELDRFAHSAWFPSDPLLLATFTAAEDGSLGSTPVENSKQTNIELYQLSFADTEYLFKPNVTVKMVEKSTCLSWTPPTHHLEFGTLISGSSSGSIYLVNPAELLNSHNKFDNGNNTAIFAVKESVHVGPVKALDFNHFQTNLFASVSDEAELFIWDIEKLEQPMTPGTKVQPPESITKVAWNPRVQHILATTSSSHCVIWDLRKSDPVVHLTKTMCQFEPHLMAWSPDIATRLCLADPNHPNAELQLWDLRFAKRMLALLGRWSSIAHKYNLSSTGNLASLAWSSPACNPITIDQKSQKARRLSYDPDLIAVLINTSSKTFSSTLSVHNTVMNSMSENFLVVWSVHEALGFVSRETTGGSFPVGPEPMLINPLDNEIEDNAIISSLPHTIPTNQSIAWLPNQPSLLSVTRSCGLISVYDILGGSDSHLSEITRETEVRPSRVRPPHRNSTKLVEAFGEELNLNDIQTCDENALGPQPNKHLPGIGNLCGTILSTPQLIPYLRIPPRWMHRPCGAEFAFGGRLVVFFEPPATEGSRTLSHSGEKVVKSMDSASEQVTRSSYVVYLNWIDFDLLEHVNKIPNGQKQSLQSNQVGALLDCLSTVLQCPIDQLEDVCTKVQQIYSQSFSDDHFDTILNLTQARLGSSQCVKSNLSTQLGFHKETISERVENLLNEHSKGQNSTDLWKAVIDSLVVGNFPHVVRLFLHQALVSPTQVVLSPLCSFATLIASHIHDSNLLGEIQIQLLDALINYKSLNLPEVSKQAGFLLRCFLHVSDWSSLIRDWQLSDWRTLLAAVVNHMWDIDFNLMRHFCYCFNEYLLQSSMENHTSLTMHESYLARCVCSIIAGDSDGLTRSWLLCKNFDTFGSSIADILQFSLLLLLLRRSNDSLNIEVTNDDDSANQFFVKVATWLSYTRVGDSTFDSLIILKLLQTQISPTSLSRTVEGKQFVNELKHRVWCNLSDEQRSTHFQSLFGLECPYKEYSHCSCGLGVTPITQVLQYPPLSTSQLSGSPVLLSEGPPQSSLPNDTNVTLHQQEPLQSHEIYSPHLSKQFASPDYSRIVNGDTIRSSLHQNQSTMELCSTPMEPTTTHSFSTMSQSSLSSIPPTIVAPQLPTGYRSYSSLGQPMMRAWNDPPILTESYQPHTKPLMTHNPYYNPVDFTPPQTNVSSNSMPTVTLSSSQDKVAFVPGTSISPPGVKLKKEIEENVYAANLLQPRETACPQLSLPLPPDFVSNQYSCGGFYLPPSVNSQPQSVYSHSTSLSNAPCISEQTPKVHVPPAYEHTNSSYQLVPGPPLPKHSVNSTPYFSVSSVPSNHLINKQQPECWPAAQPLSHAKLSADPSCFPQVQVESNQHQNVVDSQFSSSPITEELKDFQSFLIYLIQKCRAHGGKLCRNKLDDVERRLSVLYQHFYSPTKPLTDKMLNFLRESFKALQTGQYDVALSQINALIVNAVDFDTIQSFGPGLKILIQTTKQLFKDQNPFEDFH